nr:condensation domain-containing protein [Streptomyces afghaniensis]
MGDKPMIDITAQDLSHAADPTSAASAAADELARLPFDLETGPLMRVVVMRLRDDEHVLALSMHHIVSDGWSVVSCSRRSRPPTPASTCPPCPSSTPTTPPGSAPGLPATYWKNNSPTGKQPWPAHHPHSTCRPTTPARPHPPTGAPSSPTHSTHTPSPG